nr:hypothetical protein [uncultured Methanospirillum sp.]
MAGEGISNAPSVAKDPVSYPVPPSSSLTNRIYGVFQIKNESVIEEIAESNILE